MCAMALPAENLERACRDAGQRATTLRDSLLAAKAIPRRMLSIARGAGEVAEDLAKLQVLYLEAPSPSIEVELLALSQQAYIICDGLDKVVGFLRPGAASLFPIIEALRHASNRLEEAADDLCDNIAVERYERNSDKVLTPWNEVEALRGR